MSRPERREKAPAKSLDSSLERFLGATLHKLRVGRGQSLPELARASKVSASMISRIENGRASPSLATVGALAGALNVPAAYLLGDARRQTDVSFVKSGGGLSVERRGAGAGHTYQLLGHSPHAPLLLEPYLITLSDKAEAFEMLVHQGVEFMYILLGSFVYRVADRTYELSPGDSLCFDASSPHGPEKLLKTPIKLLAIIGTTPV